MNPISSEIKTGTVGELLVQIRLLQYGVQAAPPLKDSGNDLIALKGRIVKSIQVKTRTDGHFSKSHLPELYDILALVHLVGEGHQIELDNSKVYFLPAETVPNTHFNAQSLKSFEASLNLVNRLFGS